MRSRLWLWAAGLVLVAWCSAAGAVDSAVRDTADAAREYCASLAWGGGFSTKWKNFSCDVVAGDVPPDASGKYLVAKGYGIYKDPSNRRDLLVNFYSKASPPPYCEAGKRVPVGSSYKFYPYSDAVGPNDGVACQGSCEMVYVLGAGDAHYELTGAQCPAHSGDEPPPIPVPDPPGESCTADGSCTWCDPISGKCVTASGGGSAPPKPPAPPSSAAGPNGSTDSSTTSTTTTGPTSSDTTTTSTSTTTSTTTTTNVGGGTGGGGDGSGSTGTTGTGTATTTGTSTSHTEAPASSSSTSSSSKCTTGVCDVGNADGNIGTLYEGGTSSVESVYADFKADVASAPIIGAVSGFFVVGNLSGTCPVWHIPGNKYWGEAGFDFDFFCSSGMLSILDLAGWIVLALGAFCAVRIAIY